MLRSVKRPHEGLVLAMTLVFAACGGGSDGGDGDGDDGGGQQTSVSVPAAFSRFCAGVLKEDTEYLTSTGPGAWFGTGKKVRAGTSFLLGPGFSGFEGYLFVNGKPASLDADFDTGLVKDEHFTSSCASDDAEEVLVVLQRSTVYKDEAMTGSPCVLEPGVSLAQPEAYSSFGPEETVELTAEALQPICGFTEAYSRDLIAADLLLP